MPHIVGIIGFIFQISIQAIMRPHAINKLYFHEWSSESLMQTVSIIDLYNSPFETLFNIHIQPPALDFIRTIFLHLFHSENLISSLNQVDFLIYLLWSILFGVMIAIFYLWVSDLLTERYALVITLIFLFHPANTFYTSFLDSTFLTSFLIFFFYFQLWKIKNNKKTSTLILSITFCILFFTRSIFQFPFIIIFIWTLYLIGVPKSKLLKIFLITGFITSSYIVKQYYQFGLLSTSSFTGLSLNKSIGDNHMTSYWNYLQNNKIMSDKNESTPRTLTRIEKLNGSTNFNNINFLTFDEELRMKYKKAISTKPILDLAKSYYNNISIYFKPSSRYTGHVIVDRLPWRYSYDKIFSFPFLTLIIFISGIFAIINMILKKSFRDDLGFMIPALYIFFVTVLFEKGENMRFKYFLEPLLIIFITYQIAGFFKKVYYKIGKNRFT